MPFNGSIKTSIPARAVRLAVCSAIFSSAAASQPVLLEIRPRAGDTLRLRVEQQTQLIGTIIRGNRDSSISLKTSMTMFARAIVERADSTGATVLALTDSIRVTSTPETLSELDDARRSLEGKRVYMKVLPNGASNLISGDSGINNVIRALLSEIPATLPTEPVSVGATWTRVVSIPLEYSSAPQSVRTTFRLDSLSKDRILAFISMRGVIIEEVASPVSSETSGDLRGSLTLNRKRGWIVDSMATINLRAIIRRPIETGISPMKFEIRITQRMQTLGAR